MQLLSQAVMPRSPDRATEVLKARFPALSGLDAPNLEAGFRRRIQAIGISTFFTELARRSRLQAEPWPEKEGTSFAERFRRREAASQKC